MKKTIASAAVALMIGGSLALATALPASATYEECTPSEAWTETIVVTPEIPAIPGTPEVPATPDAYQRYSWVGGPTETAPTDVPPSDNWQANTDNYEGAGHGTDPVGEPFQKGDPGKGDWFYWTLTPGTPAIPAVPEVPAVPAVTQTIEHPAVTCEEPEEPVVVDPVACVATDAWYTEGDDLPPVQIEEGLLFQGGSGKAVGIRVPASGNLQGWEPLSFDSSTGGNDQFFFRIVINASADGGKAYQSLSFPGVSTIDSSSVSYQFGESIADTAERFPNAVITSIGFQTNSGAPADFSSVLYSVSGCANVDFSAPEEEEPPTEEPPVVTPPVVEPPAETPVVTPVSPEPTATTTATPATTLASTGGNDGLLGLLIAGILGLGGFALFAANHVLRARRRT